MSDKLYGLDIGKIKKRHKEIERRSKNSDGRSYKLIKYGIRGENYVCSTLVFELLREGGMTEIDSLYRTRTNWRYVLLLLTRVSTVMIFAAIPIIHVVNPLCPHYRNLLGFKHYVAGSLIVCLVNVVVINTLESILIKSINKLNSHRTKEEGVNLPLYALRLLDKYYRSRSLLSLASTDYLTSVGATLIAVVAGAIIYQTILDDLILNDEIDNSKEKLLTYVPIFCALSAPVLGGLFMLSGCLINLIKRYFSGQSGIIRPNGLYELMKHISKVAILEKFSHEQRKDFIKREYSLLLIPAVNTLSFALIFSISLGTNWFDYNRVRSIPYILMFFLAASLLGASLSWLFIHDKGRVGSCMKRCVNYSEQNSAEIQRIFATYKPRPFFFAISRFMVVTGVIGAIWLLKNESGNAVCRHGAMALYFMSAAGGVAGYLGALLAFYLYELMKIAGYYYLGCFSPSVTVFPVTSKFRLANTKTERDQEKLEKGYYVFYRGDKNFTKKSAAELSLELNNLSSEGAAHQDHVDEKSSEADDGWLQLSC